MNGRMTSKTAVSSTTPKERMIDQPQDADPFPHKSLPISKKSDAFRRKFFPNTPLKLWNDWLWQKENRITSYNQISKILSLSPEETKALTGPTSLPFAITPYYASLLDPVDPLQPLRRTMIPVPAELYRAPGESEDPLGEESQSPVEGLVHRYPDRVLFLVTSFCGAFCRYCTRSRMVGRCHHAKIESAIQYIREHKEIRDVLISGGDPLILSNEDLELILKQIRSIKHVEIIRIGTKVPMVLPQRITEPLTRMLRKYHPLMISVHATHPDELTLEANYALEQLAYSAIPLGSQTVLLSGINDSLEVMKALMHGLLKAHCRPYYLYACDKIIGSSHFRASVDKGIEIIEGLRGHTSGYAVPTFVIDAPGGGGKIPVGPEYIIEKTSDKIILKNYRGESFVY